MPPAGYRGRRPCGTRRGVPPAAGLRPGAPDGTCLRQEHRVRSGWLTVERFKPWRHYPEALVCRASDALDRIPGRVPEAVPGKGEAEVARLEEQLKRLRAAHEDLVVRYNRAIQELLKVRGQQYAPPKDR